MKHYILTPRLIIREQLRCVTSLVLILIPLVGLSVWVSSLYRPAFPYVLFLLGWFVWTFVEYELHRFWNHARNVNNSALVKRHNFHHTHPTDIAVSAMDRLIMLLIDMALVLTSFWLTPYLMILAGLGAGVFGFIMMHYILHQRWAKKAFPRLVRYHIVHHCKEPDMCFGVTVTWWDRILGTTPRKNKLIPDRVISFFYEKEKSSGAKIRVLPVIDEKLTSA